jgi:hypothetical protein
VLLVPFFSLKASVQSRRCTFTIYQLWMSVMVRDAWRNFFTVLPLSVKLQHSSTAVFAVWKRCHEGLSDHVTFVARKLEREGVGLRCVCSYRFIRSRERQERLHLAFLLVLELLASGLTDLGYSTRAMIFESQSPQWSWHSWSVTSDDRGLVVF